MPPGSLRRMLLASTTTKEEPDGTEGDADRHDAHPGRGRPRGLHGPAGRGLRGATLRGRDEIRAWIDPFDRAFPDFSHELTRVVEDEDAAYAEGVFRGTHTGPLPTPQGDVPATGREVSFRFALVVSGNLESGQASSVNVYFDQLEFLGQLGLLPEPAVA